MWNFATQLFDQLTLQLYSVLFIGALGLKVFDLFTEEEMAVVDAGRLLFLPICGCWMNTHSVFVSASTAGDASGNTNESVFSLITNSSSSFSSSSTSTPLAPTRTSHVKTLGPAGNITWETHGERPALSCRSRCGASRR